MAPQDDAAHPGSRIRAEVIPRGMSVTKAAKLMGVGRPALSNLLNGNASLSPEMASRLEKAFQVPRADLMEMQARFGAAQARSRTAPANIAAYVPPFLQIKANDIEAWATNNLQARARLAVLLRTLVHSTGRGLTKVDFPGNDDSQRKGCDGQVEANEGSPWVPSGRSAWEFGTDENVKRKADHDFDKSVDGMEAGERAEMTFVFVSPRRWTAKDAWRKEKKQLGQWKDVLVYDASDLEQWLEQSLQGQAWFANETNRLSRDVRTLDSCWADWANVSSPPLSGMLFKSAIEASNRTIRSRLSKPSEGPILLAADSHEEATAFLAQLLTGDEELHSFRDRVLVFDKPGVFPGLAASAQGFIAVTHSRDVEREFAPYAKNLHTIAIYPRNAAPGKPDVVLEPASHEVFEAALEAMGKQRDEIGRLSSDSGRSLTVLRRQLSMVPAIKVPQWAGDLQLARKLVPFLLVGAWDSTNEADKSALSLVAGGKSYVELEKDCQGLVLLDDAPTWSIGTFRGVVSKLDLLHAIAGVVTQDDLNAFFQVARRVLGEDDPSLDLEENERWAASIHGKTRQFSSAFREGISETLVLLAVQGPQLFKHRLGVDTELEAVRVVRELLPDPLTTRALEANDRDLPLYAEAAPEEFLGIIERDLRTDSAASLGLMRPVGGDFFSSPVRTGLLWALEGLAWNPDLLPRTALVLALLASVEINDNWTNKPINSLQSIFRAWMPQTAADHSTRVNVVKMLAQKFPRIGWEICMGQLVHHGSGHYSHKPRWRPDGYGFGEPFPTWGPIHAFQRDMVELALSREEHSLETLSDLVERMQLLSPEHQVRVWDLVAAWGVGSASDSDKALLREKIRTSALSRRAALQGKRKGGDKALVTAAKAAFQALEPTGIVNKHLWLFKDHWVDESVDELEDVEKIDYQEREKRLSALRMSALREVYRSVGATGLLELASRGRASWVVGVLAPEAIGMESDLKSLLTAAFDAVVQGASEIASYANLIEGALHAIADDARREAVIEAVSATRSEFERARLLMLAPFVRSTWKLVDGLGKEAASKYWEEVRPNFKRGEADEEQEGVMRLINARRPRAGFYSVKYDLEILDAELLFSLMSAIAKDGNDKAGEYQLDTYHIAEAFKRLDSSGRFTIDQMASLEFAYMEGLRELGGGGSGYGIPNLERHIEANPEMYVHALVWAYRRGDKQTDPEPFRIAPDRVREMAKRGHHLLEAIRRIPGHDDLGNLDASRLSRWIATVRKMAAELDRTEIADVSIGKLLAHAPAGEDGVWPCKPVRDVMEELQLEDMMHGAHTGLYNLRGVHWRGEGGDQERGLAEKYRGWAKALQISHPFVSSKLLMGMVRTYEREASDEDTASTLRRRLR
ncbi:HigA family addiction module antitoxin [Rhodanobacter sp. Si-c]|uniref:HigA family addiction module antitoxin n=1 Tax=Rhodanobacter lycopersici TaxID=3162487 RepID=A0ABV3QHJ8_9GAMM